MAYIIPNQKRVNIISIFHSPNQCEIERTLNFQLSHHMPDYNQNPQNSDMILTPKKTSNLTDQNYIFQSRNIGEFNYGCQGNGMTNFCKGAPIMLLNQLNSNNNLPKFTNNHIAEDSSEQINQMSNSPLNTISQKTILLNEIYKKPCNISTDVRNIRVSIPQNIEQKVKNDLQVKLTLNKEEKYEEDNFTDISLAENNVKRSLESEVSLNKRGTKFSKSLVPKEDKSKIKNDNIKKELEKSNLIVNDKLNDDLSNEKIIYNFHNFDNPIKKANDIISENYLRTENSKHSKNVSFFTNSPPIYNNETNLNKEENDFLISSSTTLNIKASEERKHCLSNLNDIKNVNSSKLIAFKKNDKEMDTNNLKGKTNEKIKIEPKKEVQFPQNIILPRLRVNNNILLCHDSHSQMINYYSESNKIGVCQECLIKFNKDNLNFIDIKDYFSKYQEKLTKLISLSNHIVEHLAFECQSPSSKDQLIQNINQKFNDLIKALESSREIIIAMIKKRFENLDKNNQSMVAEISEELIQKSNELRKAMISKKYLDMLGVLRDEDIMKKEATLLEIDESLKILREEELKTTRNNILIPNFNLQEYLKKLSINFDISGLSKSLIGNSYAKNLEEICWENNSKVFTHNYTDTLCTFSSNLAFTQDCIIEIKINKLSSSRIIALGVSNVGLKLNYGMLGYDFGPHQIAIFPNKIIGERGKIINSGLEFYEGDIIYIMIKNNEITFKVNTSKLSYTCKDCRPPYFICGTLFNKNDEVEILNLKAI